MSIPLIISLLIVKFLALFGGTALPGLVGLTMTPTLINQIIKKNKLRSIIITGTNGKTTTARLFGAVLTLAHIDFIHNRSGSNLLRGIATTLINQSNLTGKIGPKLAIWEVDEATVSQAIKAIKPEVLLITNLSRDQLDRYGEVDALVKLWQKSFTDLPKTCRILVNRADKRLRVLNHKNLNYFGQSRPGYGLNYPEEFKGKFNRDNLWAVGAICRCLRISSRLVRTAALTAPAAFGRGEKFTWNRDTYQINLVKNPASLRTVWKMLSAQGFNRPLLLILNDRLADGTDVSWIYDAPFSGISRRRQPVVVSGRRAADLALRLKYAGLNPKLIQLEPKIGPAFKRLSGLPGSPKYILPTYTALLKLRRYLHQPAWN